MTLLFRLSLKVNLPLPGISEEMTLFRIVRCVLRMKDTPGDDLALISEPEVLETQSEGREVELVRHRFCEFVSVSSFLCARASILCLMSFLNRVSNFEKRRRKWSPNSGVPKI